MTTYKATSDQWAYQEHWSKEDGDAACLLELRSRVEALEASIKQWRTDHLRLANTCASLVERVQGAIHDVEFPHGNDEARAAIREVAAWMTSNPDVYFPPALVFALEQEAEQ